MFNPKKMRVLKKFNSSIVTIILIAVLSNFLTSCATIMGRSNYHVNINSEPSNAIVHVSDKRGNIVASGVTPVTFRLKSSDGFFKRAEYVLHFSKDGYEEAQYSLYATIDGNYFLNLFSWGVFGLLVDPITGAMWKFDGKYYNVPLTPKKWLNNGNNNNNNVNNNVINVIIKKEDLK